MPTKHRKKLSTKKAYNWHYPYIKISSPLCIQKCSAEQMVEGKANNFVPIHLTYSASTQILCINS